MYSLRTKHMAVVSFMKQSLAKLFNPKLSLGQYKLTLKIRYWRLIFASKTVLKWKYFEICRRSSHIFDLRFGMMVNYWKNTHFHPFRGVWGFWAINASMSGAWFCIRNSVEMKIYLKNVKDSVTFLSWDLVWWSNYW